MVLRWFIGCIQGPKGCLGLIGVVCGACPLIKNDPRIRVKSHIAQCKHSRKYCYIL